MVSAWEYLDQHYSEEKRSEIANLFISGWDENWKEIPNWEKLEECLNLKDFINLEELDCSANNLISLDISGCFRLKKVFCNYNFLVDIKLPLNKKNLIILHLGNNNFPSQNLSCFENFTNLVDLRIGSDDEVRISQDKYNRFYGSLKYLEKLTKLQILGISNTDIDSGLEYLPTSCEKIYCNFDYRTNKKSIKIAKELGKQLEGENSWAKYYNLSKWRKENIEINSLENEMIRLTNLIKEQKDKIINAYTHFFQEKELLKQLITTHLEYKKTEKGKTKLRQQYNRIYDELAEKVGEEMMDEIEIILKDCEKLTHYENELQVAINNNQKLIENKHQIINQITYNIQNINVDKGYAMIGNNMKDNTNLSYQLSEILETKIEIPPK